MINGAKHKCFPFTMIWKAINLKKHKLLSFLPDILNHKIVIFIYLINSAPQQSRSWLLASVNITLLSISTLFQGSRLNDQRCAAPPSTTKGPTVPDEDFFSLILRSQSNRMEEQRVLPPPGVTQSKPDWLHGVTSTYLRIPGKLTTLFSSFFKI